MGAKQHGHRNFQLTVTLVRDPRPEAAQRAAATHRRFPHASSGTPRPACGRAASSRCPRRRWRSTCCRHGSPFDITGKDAEKRILLGMVAGAAGCLLGAVVKGGGSAAAFFGYGIVAVALCALLGGGLLWTRSRNGKAEKLLQAVGLQQLRDEEGRVRYVSPGLHIPGQGGPFGGQPGQWGYYPGQTGYPAPGQQHP